MISKVLFKGIKLISMEVQVNSAIRNNSSTKYVAGTELWFCYAMTGKGRKSLTKNGLDTPLPPIRILNPCQSPSPPPSLST